MKTKTPAYTIGEEIAHSILHGLGVLAATAGLVLFILKKGGFLGWERAAGSDLIAVLIFSITMIGMYLTSTLYHAIQNQRVKYIFSILDRCAISIFIAGAYTPYCIIGLGGVLGRSLLAIEWVMAILGIIINSLDTIKFRKFEIAVYLVMGWAIFIGFVPLIRSGHLLSVILLIAGGITYTIGVFWLRKEKTKNAHVVWHVFVIIGSVCHWFSIWYLS